MSFKNYIYSKVKGSDHSVLVTKDLDLSFLFSKEDANPLYDLNKFFIVVSKSISNSVIDYDLSTVKFTNNIEDVILYRNIESDRFSGFACLVAPDIGMIDSIKLASESFSNIEYEFLDFMLDYPTSKKKGLVEDLMLMKINKHNFVNFLNSSHTSARLHSLGLLDCVSSDEILVGTNTCIEILIKSTKAEFREHILSLMEDEEKEILSEILDIFSDYYLPGEERKNLSEIIKDSRYAETLENINFKSNLDTIKFNIENAVYKNKNVFFVDESVIDFTSNLSMLEIIKDSDVDSNTTYIYEFENTKLEIDSINGRHQFTLKHDIISPKHFQVVSLNEAALGLYYMTSGRMEHFAFGDKVDIDKFKSGDKVILVTELNTKIRCDNDISLKHTWRNDLFCLSEVTKLMHQSDNVKIYINGILTELVLNYNDQNIENKFYATQLGVVKAEDSDKYRSKDANNRVNLISPQIQVLDSLAYNMLNELTVCNYFNVTNYVNDQSKNIERYTINESCVYYGDQCEEILANIRDYSVDDLFNTYRKISQYILKDVSNYDDFKLNLVKNVLSIPKGLIDDYYDIYTESLKQNRSNSIDFCTIKIYCSEENISEIGVYMPFFHPVNLYDIYQYFKNKSTFIWISSNTYYRSLLLRKEVTKPLIGYVCDIFEGVLYSEADQVGYLIDKFNLGSLKSLVTSEASSRDQIFQSLISLHEYLGFTKVLNIFVVTEKRHHIEELLKCLINNSFGRYIEYNIYTNCHLSGKPYLFGIEEKDISLYTDCLFDGSFDLVIDLSGNQLNGVDFSDENFENTLRIDFGFFRNRHYHYEQYFYKEYYGFSKELKGHELLYNLSGNDNSIVLKYRNNSSIVNILERSKLFSTNKFRFNEYVGNNDVFIYEMRVENNLNNDNVGNNFFIGVNNSNQLKKHIAEILSEFCLVNDEEKSERLSNLILEERLFSFKSLLGNSNKLKGVVGELAFYCAFKRRSMDYCDSLIIPIDLISDRLKLFFKVNSRPDFLILKFTSDVVELTLVEVKSYRSITNSKLLEIYNDQLKPLNEELSSFLSRYSIESITDTILNLVEFCVSNLSYDYLQSSILINDWILSSERGVCLGKPLMVTYENERESYSTSIKEFNHIKFNYCSSIDNFESLDEDVYTNIFLRDFDQKSVNSNNQDKIEEVVADFEDLVSEDHITVEDVADEVGDPFAGKTSHENGGEVNIKVREDMNVKYQNVKQWLRRKNIYLELSERGFSIGPMIVRFYYELNTQRSSIRDLQSVILDLGIYLELNDGQKVISGYDGGNIFLDIPLKERRYYNYSELVKYEDFEEFGLSVVIGVDNLNQPVHMDFADSSSPHLLVAGTTGSGKSIAIETILGGLLKKYKPSELLVSIVDPKGVEFMNFEDFDHVVNSGLSDGIVEDADGALELLENAIIELQRRKVLFKGARAKSLKEFNEMQDSPLPRHLIIIDEYAVLVSDRNNRNLLEEKLKVIAQKARFAGIHLLIATQKPTAEVINTVIKSNLPSRLSLKVSSNTDSQVILDEVGAENLLGKGDAIFLFDGQHKIRLQICKFDMYGGD